MIFGIFHPENWGCMIQFDDCANIFQMGGEKPPTSWRWIDPPSGHLEGFFVYGLEKVTPFLIFFSSIFEFLWQWYIPENSIYIPKRELSLSSIYEWWLPKVTSFSQWPKGVVRIEMYSNEFWNNRFYCWWRVLEKIGKHLSPMFMLIKRKLSRTCQQGCNRGQPNHFQGDSGWFVVHLEDYWSLAPVLGHQGIVAEKIFKFGGCIFFGELFYVFPSTFFRQFSSGFLLGKDSISWKHLMVMN